MVTETCSVDWILRTVKTLTSLPANIYTMASPTITDTKAQRHEVPHRCNQTESFQRL